MLVILVPSKVLRKIGRVSAGVPQLLHFLLKAKPRAMTSYARMESFYVEIQKLCKRYSRLS